MAREWMTASAIRYASMMTRLFYPSAAQHQVAIVKHRRLSRRYSALWLVEMHFDPVLPSGRMQRGLGSQMLVADLHFRASRRRKARPGDPVHLIRHQARAEQVVAAPHY